jgi:hypothetical protein
LSTRTSGSSASAAGLYASSRQPESALRAVQARLRDGDVLGFALDADPGEPLHLGGERRRARAEERVEHDAARRRDEAHEVAHELGRLDGGVDVGSRLAFL